jgi:hypothetical protein
MAYLNEWQPQRDVYWKRDKLHYPTWGYLIFRTVYTPTSDVQFPLYLRNLDAWMRYQIYDEVHQQPKGCGAEPQNQRGIRRPTMKFGAAMRMRL